MSTRHPRERPGHRRRMRQAELRARWQELRHNGVRASTRRVRLRLVALVLLVVFSTLALARIRELF